MTASIPYHTIYHTMPYHRP